MKELLKKLEQILNENQIKINEPLDRHTTFRVGGPADLYLAPEEIGLSAVMRILSEEKMHVTVIGNGSNLLIGDKGIRGAVVEIGRQMSEIFVDGEYVRAKAGAFLSNTAQKAYQNGLSGLEFAAGIPGSVGGAIVMNAGAYGGEMKDIVDYVKVLSRNGEILKLSNAQMEFGYRNSCVLKNEYLVLEAAFKLKKSDPAEIGKKMDSLREQRRSKQPLEYPSAGSTFKRPEGYFAGKLIMDAGLSGYTVGGAKVSEKHCGFVVNYKDASSADILAVIRHVQKTVKERFGVDLQTEVKMLGEF